MQSGIGILVLIGFCWLLSERRSEMPWRMIAIGLSVQIVMALAMLKLSWIAQLLSGLNEIVYAIEAATRAGGTFIFGFLGGGEPPFDVTDGSAMFLFAFRVLPQIVVFTVLVAIFWHWRILPVMVKSIGWLLQKSLGVGGAIGTAGAASLFLGAIETPTVIRAYLAKLTRSEFYTLMTLGMSTVAGSVMVLYTQVLSGVADDIIGHIISASLINMIGAIYIARALIPETETITQASDHSSLSFASTIDALLQGTQTGVTLALNVGAMLLVLISLTALANQLLGWVDFADMPLSIERIFGWIFAPVAWLIGIPWAEAQTAGSLLGIKLVLNELIAYIQLAELADGLSSDTRLVLIFALCGFANFGSVGILLGGLSVLIPERRAEFLRLAPRSLISGTIVTLITGAIVSLVLLI